MEEILHSSYKNRYVIYFILICLIPGLPLTFFVVEPLYFKILVFAIMMVIFSIGLYTELIQLTEKIIISTNGFCYSNFFKTIKVSWKDILKIEVISYKYENLNRLWIEYNLVTSEGNISLKEKSDAYGSFPGDIDLWDVNLLKRVYDKIISQVPSLSIISKEVKISDPQF